MSTSLDPFTLVYNRMIKVFTDSKVKIVDWNSTKNPQSDVAGSSDLTQFQLRPVGKPTVLLGNSSCASEIAQDYNIVVLTGDLRLGSELFPAEWKLLKVLYAFQYGALDSLEYGGRPFVQRVEVQNSTSGIADPESNRKITGWASLWVVRVIMTFGSGDLQL